MARFHGRKEPWAQSCMKMNVRTSSPPEIGASANESQMDVSSSQYSSPNESASRTSVVTSCAIARAASGPT